MSQSTYCGEYTLFSSTNTAMVRNANCAKRGRRRDIRPSSATPSQPARTSAMITTFLFGGSQSHQCRIANHGEPRSIGRLSLKVEKYFQPRKAKMITGAFTTAHATTAEPAAVLHC